MKKRSDLSQKHLDIFDAKICPYCNSKTKLVPEKEIFRTPFNKNKEYVCCVNFPVCDAYTPCNEKGEPNGRLANKDLRDARKIAYDRFNALWCEGYMKRKSAYEELADFLDMEDELANLHYFNPDTLATVVKWAEDKLSSFGHKENRRTKT